MASKAGRSAAEEGGPDGAASGGREPDGCPPAIGLGDRRRRRASRRRRPVDSRESGRRARQWSLILVTAIDLEHCLGPASPSREAPVGHRHRRQVRCCRGQGYRRIARNALVSKSDRCGSAERPGRGHGPALDIPARLAYLPSLTIILDLRTFIGGGIPMMRDELVGSVVLGAMAALISMLVWGRSLVDLIAAGT